MVDGGLSTRTRHLLALRTAAAFLIVGAGTSGVALFMSNRRGDARINEFIAICLCMLLICCATYSVRYAFPTHRHWIEPDAGKSRPPYAVRASLGAALGVFSSWLVLAASMTIWQHAAKFRADFGPVRLLAGGALSGAIVGLLVYAFSAVLYMPVQGGKTQKDSDQQPILGVVMVLMFWAQAVLSESRKHPFMEALASSTQIMATVGGAMIMGWVAYSKCIPEVRNPLSWKRKPKLIDSHQDAGGSR